MPNDFFDQDRLIWRILNRVTDCLIIAILWTITSIPIITMGASSTAVYYVALKMAKNQEGYIVRSYFKAFKENFKQITIIWVAFLAVFGFFAFDFYFYRIQENGVASMLEGLIMGIVLLMVIILIYLFPIVSRFSNSTWNLFKMAVFMPFKHFLWTVVLVLLFAFMVFLAWYIIPFVVVAYGIYACISAYIFIKIFKPYEDVIRRNNGGEKEEEKEEQNN